MIPPDAAAILRPVAVRLFAAAKDRAGRETVTLNLPAGATIGELRVALGREVPTLESMRKHLLFAVGTAYVSDEASVPSDAEIVAFPPVSGG